MVAEESFVQNGYTMILYASVRRSSGGAAP
jgi:hypothetical protein